MAKIPQVKPNTESNICTSLLLAFSFVDLKGQFHVVKKSPINQFNLPLLIRSAAEGWVALHSDCIDTFYIVNEFFINKITQINWCLKLPPGAAHTGAIIVNKIISKYLYLKPKDYGIMDNAKYSQLKTGRIVQLIFHFTEKFWCSWTP